MALPAGGLQPALEVWAHVQSRPEPGQAIAALGKRNISSDAGLPVPLWHVRPGRDARPLPLEGCTTAKLYDQHKNSDDPKSMVALDGTPYTALKTAFLYRKTLINGCGCKPAPWSVAERMRHTQYKAADDAKKLQIAMAREREKAEALRKDKIAQIIAATREAVMMDEAEEATFGEAVAVETVMAAASNVVAVDGGEALTVADVDTDPEVSVTGYIHLHVLPNSVVEAEVEAAVAPAAEDPGSDVASLEAAFAEIVGGPPVKAAKSSRKVRGRSVARKAAKPVQTVSLFGGSGSTMTWPGDGPKR